MISTGRTLLSALTQGVAQGARAAYVMVTHALFAEHVEAALHDAGAQAVWSTDSVPHGSNAVPLANLLANALTVNSAPERKRGA